MPQSDDYATLPAPSRYGSPFERVDTAVAVMVGSGLTRAQALDALIALNTGGFLLEDCRPGAVV